MIEKFKLQSSHLSLIRSYLRFTSKFPDPITRAYLLNLLHQRIRRPHGTDPNRLNKRINKTIHFIETVRLKIAAANSGHVKVFEELLREAFARTGRRRQILMDFYKKIEDDGVKRPYPSNEFPRYSSILVALVTSSESNPNRNRPSLEDLQSIPTNSVITNVWSDLPSHLQPSNLGKPTQMGTMKESRQINQRLYLYDRWIDSIDGPPLIVPEPIQLKAPKKLIQHTQSMIQQLKTLAIDKGSSGEPKYNKTNPIQHPQSKPIINNNSNKTRTLIRIPSKLTDSHPLKPKLDKTNPHLQQQQGDLLIDLLSKKQQPSSVMKTCDLSNGPRTIKNRFIRRRYQSILNEIPLIQPIINNNDDQKNHKEEEEEKKKKIKHLKVFKDKDGIIVNRNWITSSSSSSDLNKYSVTNQFIDLNRYHRIKKINGEDSNWII